MTATTTSATDLPSAEGEAAPRRVFISYSHDSPAHTIRVRGLAQRLRKAGFDAWIDQFENPPVKGWPRWTRQQFTSACFVLVVCTDVYRRRFEGDELLPGGTGVGWEGFLTEQLLYHDDARNLRFVPVFLDEPNKEHVPLALQATTFYSLPNDFSKLLRRLANQPLVAPAKIGKLAVPIAEGDRELTLLREARRTKKLQGKDTTLIEERILVRRRQLRDDEGIGVGKRLNDQIELVELVGKGGFASVWRAYDLQRDHVVAVKLLHPQHVDERSRVQRIFRGARRMAALKHPGVVGVLDEGKADGNAHYFVMEYVRGGDLQRRVTSGQWDPAQSVPLLLQLADALQAAHADRLVHRDVKPANILLADDDTPKLTDFDLVHAHETSAGGQTNGQMGTFLYAAPEMFKPKTRVDCRADIYSLSMVGIFMLLGEDLTVEVIRDPDTLIARLDTTHAIKSVLSKGCAYNREDRYGSASEFAEALREASTQTDSIPALPSYSDDATTIPAPPSRLDDATTIPLSPSRLDDATTIPFPSNDNAPSVDYAPGVADGYRGPSSYSGVGRWGSVVAALRASIAPDGIGWEAPVALATFTFAIATALVPITPRPAYRCDLPQMGTLRVDGTGELFLDDRAKIKLPFEGKVPLGKHRLWVERAQYESFKAEPVVTAETSVTPTFLAMVGILPGKNFNTDVLISFDRTVTYEPCPPATACPELFEYPFAVPVGEPHRITVSRAGHETFERAFDLKAKDAEDEVLVVVDLEPLKVAPPKKSTTPRKTSRKGKVPR